MVTFEYEITSATNLTEEHNKELNKFMRLFGLWYNGIDINNTYIEQLNKLLSLLNYILDSIKYNYGLFEMCKLTPKIKIKYTNEDGEKEEFTLQEILIFVVHNYFNHMSWEDFYENEEEMENDRSCIFEKNELIESIQKQIFEYHDVSFIYDEDNINTNNNNNNINIVTL